MLGRVYLLAGVLPSAVAAIPVAVWSGRPLTQIGLTTAAVLWLITGGLAYRAARRRDFIAHRAWMMRSYSLTFAAVTVRLIALPLFFVTQDPVVTITLTFWSWVLNLMVAEWLVRRALRAVALRTLTGSA